MSREQCSISYARLNNKKSRDLLVYFSMVCLAGILISNSVAQAEVVVYNYDESGSTNGKGRLTSVSDSSGTTKFFYDQTGRITKTEKTVDTITYTTRTTYDAMGQVASVTYPDNSVISYGYDKTALVSVSEGATTYVQYSGFNALGQPGTLTYGNGVTTTYTYSNSGNPTCSQDNFRLCTTKTEHTGLEVTHQDLRYTYDNVGNVTSIIDSKTGPANGDQNFTYDDLNRLTMATYPSTSVIYAYDQIGNMTCNSRLSSCSSGSPNYAYPASGPGSVQPHAVSTAGGNSYTYDANGNMISGAGRTIEYDVENHPVEITYSSNVTEFVYDGDGGRVKKIVDGTERVYIGKLYECTASGCAKYIFAGSQRVAMKDINSGDTLYYHPDHLGSSNVVTQSNGSEFQGLAYFAYGETRYNTIDPSPGVIHKFTGQEEDDSTGLYFYNARYYDPVIGRFISADTIVPSPTDPQAFNRYSYVRNNPIIYTDPSGNFFGLALLVGGYFLADELDLIDDNTLDTIAGLGIQAFGGPMGWIGGGYLLSQSETGRYIVAGEIIVATAVATFACGGCGAIGGVSFSTIAGSALIGEIGLGAYGGYSASQAGGDISKGVLFGVSAGGISGAVMPFLPGIPESTGIFQSAFWKGVGIGAMKGGVVGVASGATGGFAGGVGDLASIGKGALLGGAFGAATGGILGGIDSIGALDRALYIKGGTAAGPTPARPFEWKDLIGFLGVSKNVPETAFATLIPNIDNFLFSTLPPVVTYGAGTGAGFYFYENEYIPTISPTEVFGWKRNP